MTGDMDVLHMALCPPSQRTDGKNFDLVSGLNFNRHESNEISDERHAIATHLRIILPYSKNLAVYSKLVACASGFTPTVNDVARFADYGNLDMVKALLDAGAPVEQGCCFMSPLYEAARRGFDDIVRLLISRGANVNHYSYLIGTPLRGAVLGASMSTARILLSHGAVCNEEVLKDAMLSEHTALAELILDHCTVENLHDKKFGFNVARTVADYKLESTVELMQKRECFTYRHGKMVPWTKEKGNK